MADRTALAEDWANKFGLAKVPLFGNEPDAVDGDHSLLLDGGLGSFALSVCSDHLNGDLSPRDWSWSSNVPHHVTVAKDEVAVVRWDDPTPRVGATAQVERNMAAFYRALVRDRIGSTRGVVDHMLWVFRRVRSLLAEHRLPDSRSVDTFLAIVAHAIQRVTGESVDLMPDADGQLLRDLPSRAVETLVRDVQVPGEIVDDKSVRFLPSLAVRHAGSEVFQEAHFELLQAGQPDMLGYVGPATADSVTRGGAHFTPPALARSLVEQTFAQLSELSRREHLTIADPACGSAVFLHEALRTLRRLKFGGRLRLVGRDISSPAVSMASFVVRNAVADWRPEGGCELDIERSDSLVNDIPPADVMLMNPPFIAWSAQSKAEQAAMREALGGVVQGRGDLSMAFITRALSALRPGGVLGTVMPGTLLALEAGRAWRQSLLERSNLAFVASLEDFGLFTYAQVQPAMLVLKDPAGPARDKEEADSVSVIVARNARDATGDALRALRRGRVDERQPGYQMFRMGHDHFRDSPVWRLTPPDLRRAIARYCESGSAALVRELFNVRQGIRTGKKRAFLLTQAEYNALPRRERHWFRAAITSDAFQSGSVSAHRFVFYPYNERGLIITELAELRDEVPSYYERHLAPYEDDLRSRRSVRHDRWWALSRPRLSSVLSPKPKLVSKYFGGRDSFAADLQARFAVVQGHAWFLRCPGDNEDDEDPDVLAAYAAILNSTAFERLLRVYSARKAGGQFDLSPRFVNEIPIPNIQALAGSVGQAELVFRLGQIGRLTTRDQRSTREVDHMVERLYGDVLRYL